MSILSMIHSRGHCSRRPGFFSFLFAGLTLLLLAAGSTSYSQGNLLITPRRVVFDDNKRSFDLNLANIGRDTAEYAVSVIQIRMTDEGGFEQITAPDPGQQFADKYIRFFPRSVKLGPGESQAVKVQLIRQNELAPGEYRSHFYFRATPKDDPMADEINKPKDSTVFSVRLTPIFGLTIPIIIRKGESTASVTLSMLSFSVVNDTLPTIRFTFNRTGNMSVYGNITVDHISAQGKITRVGMANGIAVYTPNSQRRFQMNLNKLESVDFKSGTLRVIYSAPSDVKPQRYAEAELILR
jgi:P pilus assembly chaperone PapD